MDYIPIENNENFYHFIENIQATNAVLNACRNPVVLSGIKRAVEIMKGENWNSAKVTISRMNNGESYKYYVEVVNGTVHRIIWYQSFYNADRVFYDHRLTITKDEGEYYIKYKGS